MIFREGILLLDKPYGITSQQALSSWKFHHQLRKQKIGHAGTLDPLATGLLVCALGESTKFLHFFSKASKIYEVTMVLGFESASGDLEGMGPEDWDAIRKLDHPSPALEAVQEILNRWIGRPLQQKPPQTSALKFEGQPRYRYVQKGLTIPDPPLRWIQIFEVAALRQERPYEFSFRVEVSTGTYIRSLVRDLGRALGLGATLKALRRTKIGPFEVEHASSPSDPAAPRLQKTDVLLKDFALQYIFDEADCQKLMQGQTLTFEATKPSHLDQTAYLWEGLPLARAYSRQGCFLGMLVEYEPGLWRPYRWKSPVASETLV